MRVVLLALVLALVVAPANPGDAQAAQCLSQKEQRAAVRSGQVVRPAAIRRSAAGDLLNLQLCMQGGRLVYRATVIRPNGNVRTVIIDAASGAPMGN